MTEVTVVAAATVALQFSAMAPQISTMFLALKPPLEGLFGTPPLMMFVRRAGLGTVLGSCYENSCAAGEGEEN